MSLFRKFFSSINPASDEIKESEFSKSFTENATSVDEKFIYNFKKNGGKFLYCENSEEVNEHFENILEENDWFESAVMCYDPSLYKILGDNKLSYNKAAEPKFLFTSCENLIAEEGSILFSSKQIKQHKPNELPANIIIWLLQARFLQPKAMDLVPLKRNTREITLLTLLQ